MKYTACYSFFKYVNKLLKWVNYERYTIKNCWKYVNKNARYIETEITYIIEEIYADSDNDGKIMLKALIKRL